MAISATKKAASAFEGLNIMWDRTFIFLFGCVALFLAVLTGILAPLTAAVTWPWPVFLILVGAGSIAALRYLAVQERRERAAGAPAGTAADSVVASADSENAAKSVFNNEEHVAQESLRRERDERAELDLPEDQAFLGGLRFDEDSAEAEYHVPTGASAPRELPARLSDEDLEAAPAPQKVARDIPTHDELVAAAKKVAEKSAQSSGATWEPVPVPKPTYARTAVAHREAPQALAVPKAPVASRGQSLKDAAKAPEPAPKTAGIDLDDVLNRRRA